MADPITNRTMKEAERHRVRNFVETAQPWSTPDDDDYKLDVIAEIQTAMMSDDYNGRGAPLILIYEEADAVKRAIMDETLIAICGWSLPTLVLRAKGDDDDEVQP